MIFQMFKCKFIRNEGMKSMKNKDDGEGKPQESMRCIQNETKVENDGDTKVKLLPY